MRKFNISELTDLCRDAQRRYLLWTRFNQKSFWYSDWYTLDIEDKRYYVRVLKSYNTYVGFEISNLEETVMYEIGKYSTTTSKQMTQYFNQISDARQRIFIEANTEYRKIA